jgi:serine/threonine-protein kinase RsbW
MSAVATSQIELKIPRRPEFVKLARCTAWTLAAQLDFVVSQADDIRLAVGEACTNAVEHVPDDASDDMLVRFLIAPDKLIVEVVDSGPGFDPEDVSPSDPDDTGGLGLVIIQSIMDEVDVICNAETGTCVRMTKFRNRE